MCIRDRFTIVDRIDFSNDSPTASVRGPVSYRQWHSATGNSNYSWIVGSDLSYVYVADRIDFSNDSVAATSRGPLNTARWQLAATGNSNYGWFGGGSTSSTPTQSLSSVERINFSNDNVLLSLRGPLNVSASLAIGNSNYGWFYSGSFGDRIDFSNDSVTASSRNNQTIKATGAVTGNSNYGWFGGGYFIVTPPFGTPYLGVDRINFSNDLSAVSPRGSLSAGRVTSSATSNTTR